MYKIINNNRAPSINEQLTATLDKYDIKHQLGVVKSIWVVYKLETTKWSYSALKTIEQIGV